MTQINVTRTTFKQLNKLMLLEWRLGLGPWMNQYPETVGRIMVLTTTGRKSGLKRRTPVNYARMDGDVYCLAGFGKVADWYRNLQANPAVEVWLPDGWWAGHAEEVTDPEERLPILRQVAINSGFAAEAFAGLNPRTISDEALREMAAGWPVIRIRLEQALSGPGGPGDLAWVWPVAGVALLAWLWMRRRRV
jgi:deazaflavin-dependent oxidoreductase (nitroreductase family)